MPYLIIVASDIHFPSTNVGTLTLFANLSQNTRERPLMRTVCFKRKTAFWLIFNRKSGKTSTEFKIVSNKLSSLTKICFNASLKCQRLISHICLQKQSPSVTCQLMKQFHLHLMLSSA